MPKPPILLTDKIHAGASAQLYVVTYSRPNGRCRFSTRAQGIVRRRGPNHLAGCCLGRRSCIARRRARESC
jgi:hypothetical protein